MTGSADSHVAPVTWLFGAPPIETESMLTAEPYTVPVFDEICTASLEALGRRGVSSKEMQDLLLARNFEPHDVDAEIARLERVALLDDAALAESLVLTLRKKKGLGKAALASELRRRKLDPEAIAGATLDEDGQELERATELACRRAPQLRALDSETARRRLSAYLMRRGYAGSIVSSAVERALAPSSGPVFR